ncbi:MAG: flavodoxin-dependent (E)-4-hydroxy-3-methylbut-2-enyl-diphosphate synthase [Bacillota bacterium]|nr:flavodoxin-dependent (E)-4-hydroxy-3-methylbut-2-enyl-diphosphate synthase [Bacillota bacterium]
MERKKTKKIKLGDTFIGGDSKITVQSMTNTDTRDIDKTVNQIQELTEKGCDIIRCAVVDEDAAKAIREIKKRISIPLVADIHFDYRLALLSIENGVDGLRINPGNIGSRDRVKMVAQAASDRNIPIRIGVNSGSLDKTLLEKYGKVCPEALVESAISHVNILEDVNFDDIVISIKSSNVIQTVESYKLISGKVNYPLHLGVTEAGTLINSSVKSSIGIGSLLLQGIGDTIRVSITGNPVDEVKIGREILKNTGNLKSGIEFVSCPTCGRTEIDLIKIASEVEEKLADYPKNIKVAVMGCIVNGPGEAREADIGIAGGKGEGLIFKKGEIIKKVKEQDLVRELINEIENL